MRFPVLSEKRVGGALGTYYAAFGGQEPLQAEGGGVTGLVDPETAAEIREKYLALD